jgi:hypothetical protein
MTDICSTVLAPDDASFVILEELFVCINSNTDWSFRQSNFEILNTWVDVNTTS